MAWSRRTAFALTLLALVGLPATALACSCSNGGPRNALRQSNAVFLGTVVSTSAARQEQFGPVRRASIRVSAPIKGVKADSVVTLDYLVDTGGNCGVTLKVGTRYLIYAKALPGVAALFTEYCAGTKPEECAAPDLRALGVPVPKTSRDCQLPPGAATTGRGWLGSILMPCSRTHFREAEHRELDGI